MNQLTDLQSQILQARGRVVVTACPGAGKTKVVAHLVRHLLNEQTLHPYQNIVVTSFTNVANTAIGAELDSLGVYDGDRITFGTIDAFLNKQVFIPHVSRSNLFGAQRCTLLPPTSEDFIYRLSPSLLRSKLNPNHLVYTSKGERRYQDGRSLLGTPIVDLDRTIDKLHRAGFVLQNQLTYLCYQVLSDRPQLARTIARRFPIWIIDEAQDCSELQIAIVELLQAAGVQDIFLVGDPNQSIYQWRDAHPQFMRLKCEDPNWYHIQLNSTHRFGDAICRFVNRFHPEALITTVLPSTQDVSEFEVMHNPNPKVLVELFLDKVRSKGIHISPQNVAVLFGGRSSLINPEKVYQSYFAGGPNGLHKRIADHLLMSCLAKKQNKMKSAFSELRDATSLLWESKMFPSFSSAELDPDSMDFNGIVLAFFKGLPALDISLSHWVGEINSLISSIHECSFEVKIKRRQEEVGNLLNDLVHYHLDYEITVENIHQIKGRTFEAVLVYLDSGRGNYNTSVTKALGVLANGKLFDSQYAEDGRLIYVACTRAKKLLWVCSDSSAVEQVLVGPQPIAQEIQASLF
ncbi:MAG: ATP-dependent helicase [Candidatus Gracilibacteria bacterium]|jgi:superfamily I DNA/RNA helicase